MSLQLQADLKHNLAALSEPLGGILPLDDAVLEGMKVMTGC
jgi:hypothetical protein